MHRVLGILLSSVLVLATLGLSSTYAAEKTIDHSIPGRFALGICQTDSQLDCLEPTILVSHKDGTSSTAVYIGSNSKEPFLAAAIEEPGMSHNFKVRSGTVDGSYKQFTIIPILNTQNTSPLGNLGITLIGEKKKLLSNECDDSLKKLCTRFTLDPEDKFKIVMRTQKLQAHGLDAHASDGDILREDYLSGEKWILTGSQSLIGWNPGMRWLIQTVGVDGQYPISKTAKCAKDNVLFTSSNSVTGGEPSWDSKKQSLNFGVFGPHFDANGDLFRGFFKARIPKKWLDCAYPENTLSTASQVVVSITYDDGTVQLATSLTRVTDEMIYIDVPLLHFSSPTIRIANVAMSNVVPSRKALICVKGKSKKKVLASKCPSGWKLVA